MKEENLSCILKTTLGEEDTIITSFSIKIRDSAIQYQSSVLLHFNMGFFFKLRMKDLILGTEIFQNKQAFCVLQ